MLLENGAGDADRVLFEAVEQATDQDKGEDLLVRAGNADFGESRSSCRMTGELPPVGTIFSAAIVVPLVVERA